MSEVLAVPASTGPSVARVLREISARMAQHVRLEALMTDREVQALDDAMYLAQVAEVIEQQPIAAGWRFQARMRRTSWLRRMVMRLQANLRATHGGVR